MNVILVLKVDIYNDCTQKPWCAFKILLQPKFTSGYIHGNNWFEVNIADKQGKVYFKNSVISRIKDCGLSSENHKVKMIKFHKNSTMPLT